MAADSNLLLPVETEYRGVVFRSKSEAILARNFDLLGLLWIYEPTRFIQGDLWVPDFWIITPLSSGPGFCSRILEYKPRTPTDTYKAKLGRRFDEVLQMLPCADCFLIVADPFDPFKCVSFEHWNFRSWLPLPFNWCDAIHEAADFRFDLKEVA